MEEVKPTLDQLPFPGYNTAMEKVGESKTTLNDLLKGDEELVLRVTDVFAKGQSDIQDYSLEFANGFKANLVQKDESGKGKNKHLALASVSSTPGQSNTKLQIGSKGFKFPCEDGFKPFGIVAGAGLPKNVFVETKLDWVRFTDVVIKKNRTTKDIDLTAFDLGGYSLLDGRPVEDGPVQLFFENAKEFKLAVLLSETEAETWDAVIPKPNGLKEEKEGNNNNSAVLEIQEGGQLHKVKISDEDAQKLLLAGGAQLRVGDRYVNLVPESKIDLWPPSREVMIALGAVAVLASLGYAWKQGHLAAAKDWIGQRFSATKPNWIAPGQTATVTV